MGAHGERHVMWAAAWAGAFVACVVGDWVLGRWVFVPDFVAAFYGGMIVIDLLTYPMLSFWQRWLRRRSLRAWYLVEVVGMWSGATLFIVALAPWWLSTDSGPVALRELGALLALASITIGTWACYRMGWARLLFAGALFLPGAGAEENRVPQRLVVEGPYATYETRSTSRTSPGRSSCLEPGPKRTGCRNGSWWRDRTATYETRSTSRTSP